MPDRADSTMHNGAKEKPESSSGRSHLRTFLPWSVGLERNSRCCSALVLLPLFAT